MFFSVNVRNEDLGTASEFDPPNLESR